MTSRLVTLCNSFTPTELKETSLSCLKEMLLLWPSEMLSILVPMFHRSHMSASENDVPLIGPYFPRRDRRGMSVKSVRPPRPMLQLTVPASQLEASHGQDPEYDKALYKYYWSFHNLVDLMVRVAVNEDSVSKVLIDLSAMVGVDGVPLHFQLFPKLWLDIYTSKNIVESTLTASINLLVESSAFLEYVDAVLLDERSSLNNQYVYQFLTIFFPKVSDQVINDQVKSHILTFIRSLESSVLRLDLSNFVSMKATNGDLRALLLVVSGSSEIDVSGLSGPLTTLQEKLQKHIKTFSQSEGSKEKEKEAGNSQEKPASEETEKEESTETKEAIENENKEKEPKPSTSKKARSTDKLEEVATTLLKSTNSLLEHIQKESIASVFEDSMTTDSDSAAIEQNPTPSPS